MDVEVVWDKNKDCCMYAVIKDGDIEIARFASWLEAFEFLAAHSQQPI